MIDVHFAIDFFDGTLGQRWDEAAIEAHLDELVTLDDPIEGAVAIGEAEIVDALFSAVLRLCFQCAEVLLVPSGAYHYRYVSENGSTINGVHGWGSRPIREGDSIGIGPYRLSVKRSA